MKTKKLVVVVIIVVLGLLPVYLSWSWVSEGCRNAAQGEFEGALWLPKDVEAYTDSSKFWADIKQRPAAGHMDVSFDVYKGSFSEGKHYVLVRSNDALYKTYQEKVLVTANAAHNERPRYVSIQEFKYLNGGKLYWRVDQTWQVVFWAIFAGVILGVLSDIAIVLCILVAFAVLRVGFLLDSFVDWLNS